MTMAEFPAMPLWTDAWVADTRHLTRCERGTYHDLLVEMWRSPHCALPWPSSLPFANFQWFFEPSPDGCFVPGHFASLHVDWGAHPSRLLSAAWRRIRAAFLAANPEICAYCGTTTADKWQVDHIIARARGGTHRWDNLAVSCAPCNQAKGAR